MKASLDTLAKAGAFTALVLVLAAALTAFVAAGAVAKKLVHAGLVHEAGGAAAAAFAGSWR